MTVPVTHQRKMGVLNVFYIIESGDNDITIKVIDRNNEIHELSFIIRGN